MKRKTVLRIIDLTALAIFYIMITALIILIILDGQVTVIYTRQ